MKITTVTKKQLIEYLRGSIFIGAGSTAVCFKIKDGRVLKIFYNSHNKRLLFYNRDTISHFESIANISNDSYVGPEELLVTDDSVVAYLYPYIKGKTLHYAKNFATLDELIIKYDKLLRDTKEISMQKFLLHDLHDKNLLLGSIFYVIDLDQGIVENSMSYESIFNLNIKNVNDTIVDALFNVKPDQILTFDDPEIDDLYHEAILMQPSLFPELIEKFKEKSSKNKYDSLTLKYRIGHQKNHNSYFRYF